MRVTIIRNVQVALHDGMLYLKHYGIERDSRNGVVLLAPAPVTTLYMQPRERVLFHPLRDANPFFHFFEGLWMLAGRNDVAGPAHYAAQIAAYSDDGVTMHGAYGHRWRNHFGFDQLNNIILALRENPEDRRQVLAMWDAPIDLGRPGKDLPCNTHAYFTRDVDGNLDMTVCCRSNDMIWGAYGANAVHFSMLQEVMAVGIGCEVGAYWQLSNNFHAYRSTFDPLLPLADELCPPNPYVDGEVKPYQMVTIPVSDWLGELNMFLTEGMNLGFTDPFWRKVANPILSAHAAFKENTGMGRYTISLEIIKGCHATDWRRACQEWILRRRERYMKSQDDGPTHDGDQA